MQKKNNALLTLFFSLSLLTFTQSKSSFRDSLQCQRLSKIRNDLLSSALQDNNVLRAKVASLQYQLNIAKELEQARGNLKEIDQRKIKLQEMLSKVLNKPSVWSLIWNGEEYHKHIYDRFMACTKDAKNCSSYSKDELDKAPSNVRTLVTKISDLQEAEIQCEKMMNEVKKKSDEIVKTTEDALKRSQ